MDGFELCREVKGNARTKTITVMAVTGWAGKAVEQKVHEAGFDVLLLKPVPPDALIEEIRKVVAASRSLRARSDTARSRASRLVARSGALKARIERRNKK
jgi:DNA-binding response OmpR family regulator